jgi:hypothetical protein
VSGLPIPPEPITLTGGDGRRHRFRFAVSRLPLGGVLLELGEGEFGPGYNRSTGYHFAVAGPADGSRFAEQVQHVTDTARAALAQRYLTDIDPGGPGRRTLLAGTQACGRLIWAGEAGAHDPYAVVIDGRPLSWEEFGAALEPFEGYRFRLIVEEDLDDLA